MTLGLGPVYCKYPRPSRNRSVTKTITLSSKADFESRVGSVLFSSRPVSISKERIQAFCTSLGQLDWFHFDEERCAASEFGTIVAPGTLSFSLIHATFFQHVVLENLRALFVGVDRFRVLRPVSAGENIILVLKVAEVTSKRSGFRVRYDFEWLAENENDIISVGSFIVNYWQEISRVATT